MQDSKKLKVDNVINSSCIILSIYFCLSFCFADFGVPASLFGVLLFVIALLFLGLRIYLDGIRYITNQLKDKSILALLIIFLIIVFNFMRVFTLNTTLIYYILMSFIGIVLYISTKNVTVGTVKKSLYIFIIGGLFASTIIYIERFFSVFYIHNILSIITEYSREYTVRLANLGYGASIGADVSFTAYCIVFGMFSIVSLYDRNKIKFLVPIFVYMFIALIMLQRKSELLCFILIMFIYLVYKVLNKKFDLQKVNYRKVLKYVVGIFLFMIFMFGVVLYLIPKDLTTDNRIIQMLVDLKNGRDFTNGRLALYGVALSLFKQNPIFGIGWGEFSKYAILTGNTRVRNVHCVYLQLLSEVGAIGAFLIIGSIIYNYILSLKNFFDKKNLHLNIFSFSILTQTFFIVLSFIDNAILLQHFWLIYPITLIMIFKCVDDKEECLNEC